MLVASSSFGAGFRFGKAPWSQHSTNSIQKTEKLKTEKLKTQGCGFIVRKMQLLIEECLVVCANCQKNRSRTIGF